MYNQTQILFLSAYRIKEKRIKTQNIHPDNKNDKRKRKNRDYGKINSSKYQINQKRFREREGERKRGTLAAKIRGDLERFTDLTKLLLRLGWVG